jgi:hypothetical protein
VPWAPLLVDAAALAAVLEVLDEPPQAASRRLARLEELEELEEAEEPAALERPPAPDAPPAADAPDPDVAEALAAVEARVVPLAETFSPTWPLREAIVPPSGA